MNPVQVCLRSLSGTFWELGGESFSWRGRVRSLDLPLYGALFPDLSVIPKGSCEEVVRAVKGLRGSYEHHHVEAIGLIDRDDCTQDQVNELVLDGVFALDVCSVESLYYCSDAIDAVVRRQAESLGCDPQAMIEAAAAGCIGINQNRSRSD